MPISTIVDGKVLDWHFKGHTCVNLQAFYIGDIYVGQVAKTNKYWAAAACEGLNIRGILPVDGFKTRYHAANFLLKIGGYYPKDEFYALIEEGQLRAIREGIELPKPIHITDIVKRNVDRG